MSVVSDDEAADTVPDAGAPRDGDEKELISFGEPRETTEREGYDSFDALAAEIRDDPAEVAWVRAEGALVGLDWIALRGAMEVTPNDGAVDVLLRDQLGRIRGFAVAVGRGHVIALASASPFQNRDLVDEAGAIVFRRLLDRYAPTGPVLFDEHHLGVGETRSTLRYVRQVGGTAVVLQLLLLVAWWLWRRVARFGGVRAVVPPAPGGTATYVESMGGLYERTADRAAARNALVAQALSAIARHHRSRAKAPADLARDLRLRGRDHSAKWVESLAKELSNEIENDRTLVDTAATIDRIVRNANSPEEMDR
jgi:hypothetical protein